MVYYEIDFKIEEDPWIASDVWAIRSPDMFRRFLTYVLGFYRQNTCPEREIDFRIRRIGFFTIGDGYGNVEEVEPYADYTFDGQTHTENC